MNFVTIDPEEFRKFAENSPYKSFTQTPEIAKLREENGWTAYYFGVESERPSSEDRKLIAAAMLVAKPTFLGKSTYYCPGGPLLDFEDTELTNFFFKNLKKYAKSHNGYVLNIDPYYELIERTRDGEVKPGGFNREKGIKNLKNLGFRTIKSSMPKYLFALDLKNRTEEEVLADMKRNTRNHIRKAEKMGVKVRELKREELGVFKQITESTSNRRHFEDRPLSYYENMYDLFHERGEIQFLLAEAPMQSESNISKQYAGPDSHFDNDSRDESEVTSSASRRTNRCKNDDRGPSTLRNEDSDCLVPLSVAMFMLYGDEVIYLYSGSDEQYMKDYNAQYLIQWHMIKYAAKHKYKTYNFYGIQGLPDKSKKDYGIYDFKKGFTSDDTGRVVELIGAYELPVNQPFYHLHHLLSIIKHH